MEKTDLLFIAGFSLFVYFFIFYLIIKSAIGSQFTLLSKQLRYQSEILLKQQQFQSDILVELLRKEGVSEEAIKTIADKYFVK